MSRQLTQTGVASPVVGGQRPEQQSPGDPGVQVKPLAAQVGTGEVLVVVVVVVVEVVVVVVVVDVVVVFGFVVVVLGLGFVVVVLGLGFVVVQGFFVVLGGVFFVVVQGFTGGGTYLKFLFSACLQTGNSQSACSVHTSRMLGPQCGTPPGPLAMQHTESVEVVSGAGKAVAVEYRRPGTSSRSLLKMRLPLDWTHILMEGWRINR